MVDAHTSFIPKNPNRTKKRVRTTRRIYVLSYISYVLFFGTLLSVLGVYFYKIQVSTVLTEKIEELQVRKQSFSDTDINKLQHLSRRLDTANRLLNDSTAPSHLFEDIEEVVAENIKFTKFEYEYLENKEFTVRLTGISADFNKIIYQRNLMQNSNLLESARIVEYDYSLEVEDLENSGAQASQAEDTANDTNEWGQHQSDDSTLIAFVFEGTLDGASIAYTPRVFQEIPVVSNFVTEVRTGDTSESFSDTNN